MTTNDSPMILTPLETILFARIGEAEDLLAHTNEVLRQEREQQRQSATVLNDLAYWKNQYREAQRIAGEVPGLREKLARATEGVQAMLHKIDALTASVERVQASESRAWAAAREADAEIERLKRRHAQEIRDLESELKEAGDYLAAYRKAEHLRAVAEQERLAAAAEQGA